MDDGLISASRFFAKRNYLQDLLTIPNLAVAVWKLPGLFAQVVKNPVALKYRHLSMLYLLYCWQMNQ